MGFQLGAGRTGGPEHSLYAQGGRQQVSQDGRAGGVRWKESEEVRRLPVGDSRQDNRVHIPQELVERFPMDRRCGW